MPVTLRKRCEAVRSSAFVRVVGSGVRRLFELIGLRRLGANVGVLVRGTIASQAIIIVASPVLTRLYNPSDFGTFAVYMTAFSVLATVATLRFELAIGLPKNDEDALRLLLLALGATVAVSLAAAAGAWAFGAAIVRAAGAEGLRSYLWVLPFGLAGAGAYQAQTYWALRREKFGVIAATNAGQGFAQSTLQVLLGVAGAGPLGLILGDAMGRVGASAALAFASLRRGSTHLGPLSIRELASVGSRYRSFPLLSTLSGLLNTAGLWVPATAMSVFYGPEAAGLYMVCQRIGALPAAFFGQAVAQVYYGEATRLAADSPGSLHAHYRRFGRRLLRLGVLPLGALAVLAPHLLRIVLGERWEEAGQYLRLLAPMLLAQFVVVPLSFAALVVERQGVQLAWDVARLALVVVAVWVGKLLGMSARNAIALFGVALLLTYAGLFLICDRLVRKRSEMPTAARIEGAGEAVRLR